MKRPNFLWLSAAFACLLGLVATDAGAMDQRAQKEKNAESCRTAILETEKLAPQQNARAILQLFDDINGKLDQKRALLPPTKYKTLNETYDQTLGKIAGKLGLELPSAVPVRGNAALTQQREQEARQARRALVSRALQELLAESQGVPTRSAAAAGSSSSSSRPQSAVTTQPAATIQRTNTATSSAGGSASSSTTPAPLRPSLAEQEAAQRQEEAQRQKDQATRQREEELRKAREITQKQAEEEQRARRAEEEAQKKQLEKERLAAVREEQEKIARTRAAAEQAAKQDAERKRHEEEEKRRREAEREAQLRKAAEERAELERKRKEAEELAVAEAKRLELERVEKAAQELEQRLAVEAEAARLREKEAAATLSLHNSLAIDRLGYLEDDGTFSPAFPEEYCERIGLDSLLDTLLAFKTLPTETPEVAIMRLNRQLKIDASNASNEDYAYIVNTLESAQALDSTEWQAGGMGEKPAAFDELAEKIIRVGGDIYFLRRHASLLGAQEKLPEAATTKLLNGEMSDDQLEEFIKSDFPDESDRYWGHAGAFDRQKLVEDLFNKSMALFLSAKIASSIQEKLDANSPDLRTWEQLEDFVAQALPENYSGDRNELIRTILGSPDLPTKEALSKKAADALNAATQEMIKRQRVQAASTDDDDDDDDDSHMNVGPSDSQPPSAPPPNPLLEAKNTLAADYRKRADELPRNNDFEKATRLNLVYLILYDQAKRLETEPITSLEEAMLRLSELCMKEYLICLLLEHGYGPNTNNEKVITEYYGHFSSYTPQPGGRSDNVIYKISTDPDFFQKADVRTFLKAGTQVSQEEKRAYEELAGLTIALTIIKRLYYRDDWNPTNEKQKKNSDKIVGGWLEASKAEQLLFKLMQGVSDDFNLLPGGRSENAFAKYDGIPRLVNLLFSPPPPDDQNLETKLEASINGLYFNTEDLTKPRLRRGVEMPAPIKDLAVSFKGKLNTTIVTALAQEQLPVAERKVLREEREKEAAETAAAAAARWTMGRHSKNDDDDDDEEEW